MIAVTLVAARASVSHDPAYVLDSQRLRQSLREVPVEAGAGDPYLRDDLANGVPSIAQAFGQVMDEIQSIADSAAQSVEVLLRDRN